MVTDGLVAYKRVGGSDGATLVPDLAVTLPALTDGGRVYGFQLRSGIRYSDGRLVRARDVRSSLERMFAVRSPGALYYAGIEGGRACMARPRACDLSGGIVTDDSTGRVVFHLVGPDPEFLYKLAIPFASVLPSDTPRLASGMKPVHGTGPYMIASYRPGKLLRLVRNPLFRVWSSAAKPDGYPDEIRLTPYTSSKRAVEAVKRGRLDYTDVHPEQRDELRAQFASQLHEVTLPFTGFILLNTTRPPFDNPAVRRALSYAIDRGAIVADKSGTPTCQYLPPGIPGYKSYCPYTRDPAGRWSAPALARARQLVAGSGTKGMRVTILTAPSPPCPAAKQTVAALRKLGYDAVLKATSVDAFYTTVEGPDGLRTVQAATVPWQPDFPAPSGMLTPLFRCGSTYGRYVCNTGLDRSITQALRLEQTNPEAALQQWTRIDRQIVDLALGVPVFNGRFFDFVSPRFGNYQFHVMFGLLLDQAWVR